MARHIGSKSHINTAIMVGDHTPEHLLHLMGVFVGLEEQDKTNIDMACADFAAHVKGMGPALALELAGCLGEWAAAHPFEFMSIWQQVEHKQSVRHATPR